MSHPSAEDSELHREFELRRKVCDWFRANNIDPGQIPADSDASVSDGRITFRRIVRSKLTDTPQVDPEDPLRFATEAVTVPLLVEPPPDVAEWLRPKCPTCGR